MHFSGTQFEEDDPRLKQFRATMNAVMESLSPMAVVDFLPWLINLLPSFIGKKMFKLDLIDKFQVEFFTFFQVSLARCFLYLKIKVYIPFRILSRWMNKIYNSLAFPVV